MKDEGPSAEHWLILADELYEEGHPKATLARLHAYLTASSLIADLGEIERISIPRQVEVLWPWFGLAEGWVEQGAQNTDARFAALHQSLEVMQQQYYPRAINDEGARLGELTAHLHLQNPLEVSQTWTRRDYWVVSGCLLLQVLLASLGDESRPQPDPLFQINRRSFPVVQRLFADVYRLFFLDLTAPGPSLGPGWQVPGTVEPHETFVQDPLRFFREHGMDQVSVPTFAQALASEAFRARLFHEFARSVSETGSLREHRRLLNCFRSAFTPGFQQELHDALAAQRDPAEWDDDFRVIFREEAASMPVSDDDIPF